MLEHVLHPKGQGENTQPQKNAQNAVHVLVTERGMFPRFRMYRVSGSPDWPRHDCNQHLASNPQVTKQA